MPTTQFVVALTSFTKAIRNLFETIKTLEPKDRLLAWCFICGIPVLVAWVTLAVLLA